jgi:enoyl-[acyl-carrier-protein] reductase (NADH)
MLSLMRKQKWGRIVFISSESGVAEIESNFFKNERPGSSLQRFATPEEVANLVVYYSSPISSGTNGAAIRVDGGVVRSIL